MTDAPSPFAPFQLPTQSGSPEVTIEQSGKREKKIKVAEKASDLKVGEVVVIKPDRKKPEKKTGLKAYSPKFELQAILAVAATLNEDDFPLFEKLIIALDEAGKPARERIMAAIGKVFG